MITNRLNYAPLFVAACALLPGVLFPAYAQLKLIPMATAKKEPPTVQSVKIRPANVSPATWAKIRALKPGRTRANLEKVFQTEGGLSSRLWRSYILPHSEDAQGQYLKIDVEYAPAQAPLVWRDGKGVLRNPEDVPKAAQGREMPSDIIISLSPLYRGSMNIR